MNGEDKIRQALAEIHGEEYAKTFEIYKSTGANGFGWYYRIPNQLPVWIDATVDYALTTIKQMNVEEQISDETLRNHCIAKAAHARAVIRNQLHRAFDITFQPGSINLTTNEITFKNDDSIRIVFERDYQLDDARLLPTGMIKTTLMIDDLSHASYVGSKLKIAEIKNIRNRIKLQLSRNIFEPIEEMRQRLNEYQIDESVHIIASSVAGKPKLYISTFSITPENEYFDEFLNTLRKVLDDGR